VEERQLFHSRYGKYEGTVTADNHRFRVHLENILIEYPLSHEDGARYFFIAEDRKKRVMALSGINTKKSYWKAAGSFVRSEVYWTTMNALAANADHQFR